MLLYVRCHGPTDLPFFHPVTPVRRCHSSFKGENCEIASEAAGAGSDMTASVIGAVLGALVLAGCVVFVVLRWQRYSRCAPHLFLDRICSSIVLALSCTPSFAEALSRLLLALSPAPPSLLRLPAAFSSVSPPRSGIMPFCRQVLVLTSALSPSHCPLAHNACLHPPACNDRLVRCSVALLSAAATSYCCRLSTMAQFFTTACRLVFGVCRCAPGQ